MTAYNAGLANVLPALGQVASGLNWALTPFLGGLIADTFRMMPYTETGAIANDPTDPMPAHRTTMLLKDLSPATIDAILRVTGVEGSAPVMVFEIRHLGGAMARVPAESAAFSQRTPCGLVTRTFTGVSLPIASTFGSTAMLARLDRTHENPKNRSTRTPRTWRPSRRTW